MSTGEIYLLGAIAGLTIFLGLPVGRMRNVGRSTAAFLNAGAAGVLVFLLIETTEHAFEPVEEALAHVTVESGGTWGAFVGKSALFVGAFAVGLLGLVYYERWMDRRVANVGVGPGAASVSEYRVAHRIHSLSHAKRLALFIAIGIGLHNFAEGLAIGVSASTGEIGLATVLIIGFAVHNATEGFGIVGPLGDVRPSWRWLALAGLIGGGPVFLGAIVGYNVTSEPLELLFYSVSAGAILYVIGEIWGAMRRLGHRELGLLMLGAGVFLGVATEMVIAYGGG
jgi:zinc transporter, ZIP family